MESLENRQMLAAEPIISEFVASNSGGLKDGNGLSSDWIELYNAGDQSIDLAGWHLTDSADNLAKWTFPSKTLAAGDYLVVFASNQLVDNYVDPQGNLHTNFQLDPEGEYLALVRPDGVTIASEFTPKYPEQYTDIAYGVAVDAVGTTFVDEGAHAEVLVPADGNLGTTWTAPDFSPDNNAWITESAPGVPAVTGVGYVSEAADPNLVAYWPLDELPGTTGNGSVLDVHGDQNGSPFGSTVFGAAGAKANTDTSYEGNGSNTGVRVPYTSNLNTASFTASAWVYPHVITGSHAVINSSNTAGGTRGFGLYNTGGRWQFWTGDGANWDVTTGPLVTPNQWVHFAISFDAATNTKRFFRNGQQIGTTTAHGYVPNTVNDLFIGAAGDNGTTSFFDGQIDDVAFFNRALTATELTQIVNDKIPVGGESLLTDLVATDVISAMRGVNASAYVRIPFQINTPLDLDRLLLRVKYNDGFVAYLNGQLVASHNAPASPQWNSAATGSRSDEDSIVYREFNISSALPLLRNGQNVLAIHGLNNAVNDSDFLVLPQLEGLSTTVNPSLRGYFTTPSPREPNPTALSSLGPLVTDVVHTPNEPRNTDPVIVTARIAATDQAVGTVQLTYRRMFGAEINVAMNDTGTLGDAVAGDGIYTGTIPASGAVPGEMLRYFISAGDVSNNLMRSPRVADTLGTDQDPQYYGTVIADPAVTSNLPILHWFAQNPSAAGTRSGSRASVYFNGEFYDNIFVRQRGGATNGASQKFNFNSDHKFRVNDELGRVAEFNLNAQGSDPSYIRQPMAFEDFREVGNPSSISFLMRTEVNGNFSRVGVFIEQVDEDFLERNDLDPEGALYKFVQRSNLNPVFADTTTGIEKKTRLNEDFADVAALVAGLNLSTAEARQQFIFDNLNLPQIINYLAVRAVTMDADDVRKNFYMYRDTNGTQEWNIFPWDKDWTYGVEGDGGTHLRHPFFGEQEHLKTNANQWNLMYDVLFANPITREMYLRRLRSVMDELLQPPGTPQNELSYEQRVDAWFAPAAPELGAGPAGSIPSVKSYFPRRRTDLYVTHNIDNASFGNNITLIPEFVSGVQYFVPSDNTVTDWTNIAPPANIGAWSTGQAGIGFDTDVPVVFTSALRTVVRPNTTCATCTSIYARIPFNVTDPASLSALTLRMKYDDGFVAYLNGTEVARANVTGTPQFDTNATIRSDGAALNFQNFVISSFMNRIQPGQNMLAIQIINTNAANGDLLMSPSLVDGIIGVPDTAGIPHGQNGNPSITFDDVNYESNPASGIQDEEYLKIDNPNRTAVDISNWRLEGGVEMTFRPGTVIPANGSLYLSPDVVAFRTRQTGPSGNQSRFVQGPYSGHISNFGETLRLVAQDGTVMDTLVIPPDVSDVQQYLRLSEILYNPPTGLDTEFIELLNISTGADARTLDLSGVTVSDGPSLPFVVPQGTTLAAGERMLIAANPTAFRAAYPNVTATILGPFEGALSNAGERVKVNDALGNTVADVTYGDRDPWPQQADSAGASLELIDPFTTPRDETDKPYRWRGSAIVGGSPGQAGAGPIGIVINEVLTNTNNSNVQSDAIELYNPTSNTIVIGGWYLADSLSTQARYQIPAGTSLAPGKYMVFDESDFNPTPATPAPQHFSLDGVDGDDVWLFRSDASGNIVEVVDEAHFGGSPFGVALGRATNGAGRITAQSRQSLGCANSPPAASSVLISEIQYHPVQPSAAALEIDPSLTPDDLEFVEIYNPSSNAIDLTGWELDRGVDYTFAAGQMLGSRQTLVVLRFDPASPANVDRLAAFRAHYGLPNNVTIVGGYSDSLSDSGEIVRLMRRLDATATGANVVVDEVYYDDRGAWGTPADGSGSSLQRKLFTGYGNAATSWLGVVPTPGLLLLGSGNLGDFNGDGTVNALDIDQLSAAISQGSKNLHYDLDTNGSVDAADITRLLTDVLRTIPGDANLDGVVDASDFNRWNAGKFQDCYQSWGDGDFNGDGRADGADFNIWNARRFTAPAPAASVPRAPRAPLGNTPASVIDQSQVSTDRATRRLSQIMVRREGAARPISGLSRTAYNTTTLKDNYWSHVGERDSNLVDWS